VLCSCLVGFSISSTDVAQALFLDEVDRINLLRLALSMLTCRRPSIVTTGRLYLELRRAACVVVGAVGGPYSITINLSGCDTCALDGSWLHSPTIAVSAGLATVIAAVVAAVPAASARGFGGTTSVC